MRTKENDNYCKLVAAELIAIYDGTAVNEDGEEKTFYDYLAEDVLDYDFVINRDKTYKACMLWVTLGGPSVWIDTNTNTVQLRWGGEKGEAWLPSEVCEMIDDTMSEIYSY